MYISYFYTKVLIDYCIARRDIRKDERHLLDNIQGKQINNINVVDKQLYMKVLSIVLQYYKKEDFIADINSAYRLSSHGFLGLAAYCAPTIKDLLLLVVNFSRIEWPFVKFNLKKKNKEQYYVEVKLLDFFSNDINEFILETSLASLCFALYEVLGKTNQIEMSTKHTLDYKIYNNKTPYLNINRSIKKNCITLPTSFIHHSIETYNEESYKLIVEKCIEAVKLNKEYSNNFLSMVKSTIVNHKEIISLGQLAEITNYSKRTISRKLCEADTTFNNLIHLEKKKRALDFLKTDKSIDEIARKLSFSSTSAFSRFAVNSFGKSPSALRKELNKL
jgi:AraC-like DNA-binding protein